MQRDDQGRPSGWMDKAALSEEEHIVPHAFLVGCYFGKATQECEEHLDELALLTEAYGGVVEGRRPCLLRRYEASTYVTSGKLEELVAEANALDINLVIFDDEISPAQQRNLEAAFGVTVMDRTELILEVFSRHARSREARLQIELAQVKYQFPRLKRLWTHLSRQSAGGGGAGSGAYLKGEGEKQIEIDRRLLQRRLDKLEAELKEMVKHRDVQRSQRKRSGIPQFAIIGYTNAGKSTLLNALTEAGVLVQDQLFATLDTSTRRFMLPNNQEVLLIDTVGFIRKLPHQLVASFRSTLEEALEADILLHLVDVSHPQAFEQAAASHEVLKELGDVDVPILTVLNKIDVASDPDVVTRLRLSYPKTVQVSALTGDGLDELAQRMMDELSQLRQTVSMRIPQSDYKVVSQVTQAGNVLSQDYEDNDVLLEVELPSELLGPLQRFIVEPTE